MKEIKINGIGQTISVFPGEMQLISIENLEYYKKILINSIDEDESFFEFYKDIEKISFFKNSLVIINPFDLNPNDKKILNNLYKQLGKTINEKSQEKIESINAQLLQFIHEITYESNTSLVYNDTISPIDLFALYKLRFPDISFSNYLEYFLNYIKANLEIKKFEFVLSFNLLSLFTPSQLDQLQKELSYLDIAIIDIRYVDTQIIKNIKHITIDKDLCEF